MEGMGQTGGGKPLRIFISCRMINEHGKQQMDYSGQVKALA